MRLRGRIIAAAATSFVGLAIFGAAAIWDAADSYVDANQARERIGRAPTVSALAHELQKERGLSAGYIGANGGAFTQKLVVQRRATDAALADFNVILQDLKADNGLRTRVDVALARVDSLAEHRADVTDYSASVAEMAGYYTPLIRSLLDVAGGAALGLKNGAIVNDSVVYTSVLQAKERAGVERAMGANGFGGGAFSASVYQKFIELGSEQTAFMSAARDRASPAQIAFFDQTLNAPANDRVMELRAIARESAFGSGLRGVTGPQWFDVSTARIELFKTVEDAVAADLEATAAAAASASQSRLFVWLGLLVGMMAICGYIAKRISDSLTKPMNGLVAKITQVSNGETDVQIDGADRPDEIGEIARSLVVFRDNEKERRALAENAAAETELRERRSARIEEMIGEFQAKSNEAIASVDAMANELSTVSASLADTVATTRDGAEHASASSAEAASSVQSVAAAVEELSASIGDITTRIATSQSSTESAAEAAGNATECVRRLDTAVESVGSVAVMIAEIAAQTNLLALNATIEAERAGESGRGFAVVAQEVKELASQTAAATTQITEQINEIQSETKEAVSSIDDIAARFDELRAASETISTAIEQQTLATTEISRGVHTAASGSETASQRTARVAEAADATSGDADAVRAASHKMTDVSADLEATVNSFLDEVKSA